MKALQLLTLVCIMVNLPSKVCTPSRLWKPAGSAFKSPCVLNELWIWATLGTCRLPGNAPFKSASAGSLNIVFVHTSRWTGESLGSNEPLPGDC